MVDRFSGKETELDGPAREIFLISPDDDNDLELATRGISFAVAGDLEVIPIGGETAVVIPENALAAGAIHPIRIKRVLSSNTTATGIVGYA